MRPIFFGRSDRRLFGIYHPPQNAAVNSTGVVICPSIAHEYVRSHRALRNLAAILARRGCAVLRFDYFGCGDSAGEAADVTLQHSVEDAVTAAAELRRLSSARTLSFIGQRFGAVVALLASGRADGGAAILWDPIVRGSVYLQNLADLHSTWMQSGGRSAEEELACYPDALLGFTLSHAFRAELMAANLLKEIASRVVTAPLSVILSEQTIETAALTQSVGRKYGDSAVRSLSEPAGWQHPDFIHTALAAPHSLQSIAACVPLSSTLREVPVRSSRV